MSTATIEPVKLEEKYHFLLRKLHSLSGIVPIGVFLIEHLLTNSMAFAGSERFNESVLAIHHLPYLWALELFGIFLPLAFHAGYGIKIAMTAHPNVRAYPYMANWRYTLQRATGYIALVFIIIHLLKFRFAHIVGWGPDFLDPNLKDKFEITRHGLMAWTPFKGVTIPAGITLGFYVIGLAAAVFHFANGIWTFCISWGITVGAKAQKYMGYVAATVGVLLFAWGALSLYAFAKAEPPKPDADQQIVRSSLDDEL